MNILQLGLNIETFDENKKKILNEYIVLFDKLSQYDGKVYNPVLGTGLVEFNNSISQTNKLIEELNSKITTLSSSTSSNSATTKAASISTKELTAEQAALKVKTQEANKAMIDQAKSQNETIQLRLLQKKISQEMIALNKAEFDQETAFANQIKADQRIISTLKKQEASAEVSRKKQLAKDSADQEKADQKAIKAIKDQEVATAALNNRIIQLRALQKEQSVQYANAHLSSGVDSEEAKLALSRYSETSKTIEGIDTKLHNASRGASAFGKTLTGIYSQLRILAYILPGLGIAGIFNVAIEAVSGLIDELSEYGNATKRAIDNQLALNKTQETFLELLKQVQNTLNSSLGASQFRKDEIKNLEAEGRARQTILEKELEIAKTRARVANLDFFQNGGFDKQAEAYEKLAVAERKLKDARLEVQKTEQGDKGNDKDSLFGNLVEKRQRDLDLAQSNFNLIKEEYNKIKAINEENANARSERTAQEIALETYKAEQIRKLVLETSKLEVDNIKSKNKIILGDERSTLIQRIAAIKSNESAIRKEIQAGLNYTLDRPDARKADGKYTEESILAIRTANEKRIEANREYLDDVDKVTEEYRQRYLKATTNINKNVLDQNAISNERIFKNEEKSLSDRLLSYTTYIKDRQKIQDLEYLRDIQKRGLTEEEKLSLISDSHTLQANIQADVEKQVYDIVYQSLQKQLKAVLDTNKLEEEDNKLVHAKELTNLNNLFKNKEISLKEYSRRRKSFDEEYRIKDLDVEIKSDQDSISRLKSLLLERGNELEKANKKEIDAKKKLNIANETGIEVNEAKREFDAVVGYKNALKDEILNAEKELKKAQQENDKDELARAQIKYDQLLKIQKAYADARNEIVENLYKLIKTAVDAEYEQRLEKSRLAKETTDEQYNNEIAAVERSQLSAKDKAALDIQLNAEKQVADKNAAVEEKKLKREQAIIDRELTIAHILWATEQAVINALALPLPPPVPETIAIERGIAGAIAAATVLAVPLPSFKDGVIGFEGGYARTGEAGAELIKEPYSSPYFVTKETISYLPKGTDVIPIDDIPDISTNKVKEDGWEQTRWLAKQLRKDKKEIKNIFKPIINVDISFEKFKREILG